MVWDYGVSVGAGRLRKGNRGKAEKKEIGRKMGLVGVTVQGGEVLGLGVGRSPVTKGGSSLDRVGVL